MSGSAGDGAMRRGEGGVERGRAWELTVREKLVSCGLARTDESASRTTSRGDEGSLLRIMVSPAATVRGCPLPCVIESIGTRVAWRGVGFFLSSLEGRGVFSLSAIVTTEEEVSVGGQQINEGGEPWRLIPPPLQPRLSPISKLKCTSFF